MFSWRAPQGDPTAPAAPSGSQMRHTASSVTTPASVTAASRLRQTSFDPHMGPGQIVHELATLRGGDDTELPSLCMQLWHARRSTGALQKPDLGLPTGGGQWLPPHGRTGRLGSAIAMPVCWAPSARRERFTAIQAALGTESPPRAPAVRGGRHIPRKRGISGARSAPRPLR